MNVFFCCGVTQSGRYQPTLGGQGGLVCVCVRVCECAAGGGGTHHYGRDNGYNWLVFCHLKEEAGCLPTPPLLGGKENNTMKIEKERVEKEEAEREQDKKRIIPIK